MSDHDRTVYRQSDELDSWAYRGLTIRREWSMPAISPYPGNDSHGPIADFIELYRATAGDPPVAMFAIVRVRPAQCRHKARGPIEGAPVLMHSRSHACAAYDDAVNFVDALAAIFPNADPDRTDYDRRVHEGPIQGYAYGSIVWRAAARAVVPERFSLPYVSRERMPAGVASC